MVPAQGTLSVVPDGTAVAFVISKSGALKFKRLAHEFDSCAHAQIADAKIQRDGFQESQTHLASLFLCGWHATLPVDHILSCSIRERARAKLTPAARFVL